MQRYSAQRGSFPEVEKRLACEGMLTAPPSAKPSEIHQPGQFDEPMRQAVIRFQHKHMLYDAAALRPDTMAALGRTLARERLRGAGARPDRAHRRRPPTSSRTARSTARRARRPTSNAAGETVPVRNLVDEAVKATLEQLDLDDAGQGAGLLPAPSGRRAARRCAPRSSCRRVPEYYATDMDLSVVIDRGDVIYDPLFDEKGKPTPQTRHHFPMLTLRVKYPRQVDPADPLAHHHRRLALGSGVERLRILPLQGLRRGAARVAQHRLGAGVDRAELDADPHAGEMEARARRAQQVVNYDEVGPGLSVGLRARRRLQRRAGQERQARLGQRRARARLVGDPVDSQSRRLLARLPSPDEPSGGAHVLVRAAPPAGDRRGRQAARFRAPVPLQGRRVRDAAAVEAATTIGSSRRCRSACSRATSSAR